MLNVAMFGMTARQWREANPDSKGNIRDYATINELICLSNMENLNAVFISQGLPQGERLVKLNKIAIQQMSVLEGGDGGGWTFGSINSCGRLFTVRTGQQRINRMNMKKLPAPPILVTF